MDFLEAACLLEAQFPEHFQHERLMAFAEEDRHGGRDNGTYPVGVSINSVEGRLLYALARMLTPEHVLEIGCADGCSAVHLLAALNANNSGDLTSIDVDPTSGRMVTPDLSPRWMFISGDARQLELPTAAIVFEDAEHSYEVTRDILLRVRALNPLVVVSHDYYRHLVDPNVGVKQAFDEVFGAGVIGILFDDTQTGLGVWLNRDGLRGLPR